VRAASNAVRAFASSLFMRASRPSPKLWFRLIARSTRHGLSPSATSARSAAAKSRSASAQTNHLGHSAARETNYISVSLGGYCDTMADISFECPKCNQPLDAPQQLATQFIECATCKEVIEVPARSEPTKPRPIPPDFVSTPSLIVTTGNEVTGRPIESYLGVARGIVVRSPNLDQRLLGGLKQLVGGNIESYALVCEESRRQAFDRMLEHAKADYAMPKKPAGQKKQRLRKPRRS
jgi:putative heavy-metal-binding protein